ncbi:MAG: acyltransferase [Syntrophales bacterium]|nr:acyltransferase [Syntrophales bacterium]
MNSFYPEQELRKIGFAFIGKDIKISRKASIYNPQQLHIGDNSRIDDFCILSPGTGGIVIGKHVHIACYTSLIGKGKIIIEDFVNLSSKVGVYSSSDDYSGAYMTNPTIPSEYTHVMHSDVTIGRHVIIGAGSVVLPGVVIGEGAAVGALSLVVKDCRPFTIYGGVPAKELRERKRGILHYEKLFTSGKKKTRDGESE